MPSGLLGQVASGQTAGVAAEARCVTEIRASSGFDVARPSGRKHDDENQGDRYQRIDANHDACQEPGGHEAGGETTEITPSQKHHS